MAQTPSRSKDPSPAVRRGRIARTWPCGFALGFRAWSQNFKNKIENAQVGMRRMLDCVNTLGRSSIETRRELENMERAGILIKKEFQGMKNEGKFEGFEYDRVS